MTSCQRHPVADGQRIVVVAPPESWVFRKRWFGGCIVSYTETRSLADSWMMIVPVI